MAERKRYCPYCGTALTTRESEGRPRLYCPACPRILYQNPVPSTAVVVFDDRGGVLLTRRSVAPRKGEWCLPGGFLETGEDVRECARRELHEETGLKGFSPQELGSELSSHPQYESVLVHGVWMKKWEGELCPGDDADRVGFFPEGDAPAIAFRSHRILLARGRDCRQREQKSRGEFQKDSAAPVDFGAYVITSGDHLRISREACRGGARVIQYREPGKNSRDLLDMARRIREVTRRSGTFLVVNDRLDIALAADADGVHLGQGDLPVREARAIAGPEMKIGVSTHSLEQARRAESEGADYIGCGPIFATPTKPDYPPVGISLIRRVLKQVRIPVVAIGGIDRTRARELAAIGVKSIAMVREFQQDTARRVREVNRLLEIPGKRP